MLNIGLGEILLVTLVLLLFVGPERLPGVLRWLGKGYGKLRRATNELQNAFMDEAEMLDSLKNPAARRPPAWYEERPAARGPAAPPTGRPTPAPAVPPASVGDESPSPSPHEDDAHGEGRDE